MGNLDIGKYLRERRMSLNLSLEEVANYCGVSKSTVSRWENGHIDKIKRGHIYLISQKLHIPVELILGLEINIEVEPAETILKREEIIGKLSKIKDSKELESVNTYIDAFILVKKK